MLRSWLPPPETPEPPLAVSVEEINSLRRSQHSSPHAVLGAHVAPKGALVRVFHPDAVRAELLLQGGRSHPMQALGGGVYGSLLPGAKLPLAYRVRFQFANGATWERDDPYRFLPTLGDLDLHLFNEGKHHRLWEVMGAHARTIEGVTGTSFAVWAPNAIGVSLVGDFNDWDGRLFPMRVLGSSGVFELFVPDIAPGALYKFEVRSRESALRLKTDPFAQAMELPPNTASKVFVSQYTWGDSAWMQARKERDLRREPVSIYEVHLGSWARVPEAGDRWLTYREIAPKLLEHVRRLGFTHVELLPIAEHAFYGSWGYQVTGYYAPTARYGSPDDFRYFVDHFHQNGIGVIVDWVPAHFPKDDFSLRRFDGTPLFEHEDARLGEHPDWGTLIFNFGRNEVKNFLVANALYWLTEFHVDGLRVDAVASMLYLDYSRKEGEWVPNPYGGRENIAAIDFLREFNSAVAKEVPGAFTIAEESTAWGGVTRPAGEGGLGFTFKWNMGWMHDTLLYLSKQPVHRKYHHDQLTFAMIYEFSERFVNSISHDEVVHGKGSLIEKMPGDMWQKLANLRLLLAYQFTRPGKQLIFMGTELAQHAEWNHERSLDWHLLDDPRRQALMRYLVELGSLHRSLPPLWRGDPDPGSFEWLDCSDRDNSVVGYIRRAGAEEVLVIFNFTPVPREDYRIGVSAAGAYRERLSSDNKRFGGSDYATVAHAKTEPVSMHGRDHSILLKLPPLGALIWVPAS